MELSPEERQRIYLEEKARLEAQTALKAEAEKKKGWGCGTWILALIVGCLALMLISLIVNFKDGTGTTATVAGSRTFSVTWYCGEQSAAIDFMLAASRNDTAAMEGLISRGKLSKVEKGAKVRVYFQDGPLSRVNVESGFSTGEGCWIPTKLLQ